MSRLTEAFEAFYLSQNNVGHFERESGSAINEDYAQIFESPAIAAANQNMLNQLKAAGFPATPPAHWKVLDIGSSLGAQAFAIQPFVRDVTGIDVEPEAIACAEAWRNQKNIPGITFKVIDASRNLEDSVDGPFDLIIIKDVTEHLATAHNLDNLMMSASKLLAPNGAIYLETPNYLVPYEPHLQIVIPPLASINLIKKIAKLRKIKGSSDESFFSTLLVLSPYRIIKSCKEARLKIFDVGNSILISELMDGTKTPLSFLRHGAPILRMIGKSPLRKVFISLAQKVLAYPTVTFVLTRK